MKRKIVSIRLNVAEATTEFVQAFNPLAWDNAYRPSDQEIFDLANLLEIILTDKNWIEQLIYKERKGYITAAVTGFIANYLIIKDSPDNLVTIQSNKFRIHGHGIWWEKFQEMVRNNLSQRKEKWPGFLAELPPLPLSFWGKVREDTSLLGELPKTLWRYTVRGATNFSVGFKDGVSNFLWFLKK